MSQSAARLTFLLYALSAIVALMISQSAQARKIDWKGELHNQFICIDLPEKDSKYLEKYCFSSFKVKYRVGVYLKEPFQLFGVAWVADPTIYIRGVGGVYVSNMPPPIQAAFKKLKPYNLKLGVSVHDKQNIIRGAMVFDPGSLKGSDEGFGFDVPGSPSWDSTFINHLGTNACSYAPYPEKSDYLDEKTAKSIMQEELQLKNLEICTGGVLNIYDINRALENSCEAWESGSLAHTKCKNKDKKKQKEAKKKEKKKAKKRLKLDNKQMADLDKALNQTENKNNSTKVEADDNLDKAIKTSDEKKQKNAKSMSTRANISKNNKNDKLNKKLQEEISKCESKKPTLNLVWEGPHEFSTSCCYVSQSGTSHCEYQDEACLRREDEEARRMNIQARQEYEREMIAWPQKLKACKDEAQARYNKSANKQSKKSTSPRKSVALSWDSLVVDKDYDWTYKVRSPSHDIKKCGYKDKSTKKQVIPKNYIWCGDFQYNGRAKVFLERLNEVKEVCRHEVFNCHWEKRHSMRGGYIDAKGKLLEEFTEEARHDAKCEDRDGCFDSNDNWRSK